MFAVKAYNKIVWMLQWVWWVTNGLLLM